jgi:hypothetical protein
METTTKKSPKKAAVVAPDMRIQMAYIDHLLTHGKRPVSVFVFCRDLGIKEEEFYNHFGSFDGVERTIWKSFIARTVMRLHTDESFRSFSVREKILTFYYSFFEELKSNRSFVLLQLEHRKQLEVTPEYLKDFRKEFDAFIDNLITAGKASGEIATRPIIDSRYVDLFWLHFGFLLLFWRDDNSPGFEKTDAAIEKSVNVAFDLIGKGALDSVIDFAKFLYQIRKS